MEKRVYCIKKIELYSFVYKLNKDAQWSSYQCLNQQEIEIFFGKWKERNEEHNKIYAAIQTML